MIDLSYGHLVVFKHLGIALTNLLGNPFTYLFWQLFTCQPQLVSPPRDSHSEIQRWPMFDGGFILTSSSFPFDKIGPVLD